MNHLFLTHRLRTFTFCYVLLMSLYGCGVSTQEYPPSDSPTTIFDFSLWSDLTSMGSPIQIDLPVKSTNVIASAFFHVDWDVESSDPYSVTAFISTDNSDVLGGDDEIFLNTECGSNGEVYACDNQWHQECAVSYEPEIDIVLIDHYYVRCPHGPATISQVEITGDIQGAGFPGIPYQRYFVFKFCNKAGVDCKSRITLVQILDLDTTD